MDGEDWKVEPALAATVDAAAETWRQGDVFADTAIVRYADGKRPLTAGAAKASGLSAIQERLARAVILSQTCEVVRPCDQRPIVHLAEVVELEGSALEEAKRGWRPQYAAVPWAGENAFADLEVQGMVEKTVLSDREIVGRCPDAASQLKFGRALGRHRARFAFPDDLSPTLKPLVERLRDKAGKDTPQGRRIDDIVEIRARASPKWEADDVSVELVFLLQPSALPPLPYNADPPVELLEEIASVDAQRLAEVLDDKGLDPVRRNAVWQRLTDAWSSRAKPTGAITEVTSTAVALTEFSRSDDLACPELDLDYLSD